jgi:hypothetical protein
MTLVPAAAITVTGVTLVANGILTFAATAGILPGAIVSLAGATSAKAGIRARVIAVTVSTVALGGLEDVNGRAVGGLGSKGLNLTGYAIGDVLTQEEQMMDLKPWQIPVADATPVRTA